MRNKHMLSIVLAGGIVLMFAGCSHHAETAESGQTTTKQQTDEKQSMMEAEVSEITTPIDEQTEETEQAENPSTIPEQTSEQKNQETERTEPEITTKKPVETVSTAPEVTTSETIAERTTEIDTTKPSVPPQTTNKQTTEASKNFTQADHERIISEVKAYAESYAAKGFKFEWNDSMKFGWDVGYMGTPRIKRDGVDGVIQTLKYHIDLIYQTSTNPQYGLVTDYMTYKVEQITIDGETAYVVIYGG